MLDFTKENNFDSLRLFAALCVVVQHAVIHLDSSFLWFENGENGWFWDGVPLFFVISGLLVFRSCEKFIDNNRPILQYYQNRFLRIAPGIYGYFAITTLLLLAIGVIQFKDLFKPEVIGWAISNIILVPVYNPVAFNQIGVGVLNGSLWTIPTEFSFYIILPLLVFLSKKIRLKNFSFILAVISLIGLSVDWITASYFNENIISKLINITFLPYMLFFTLGIVLGKYWINFKHNYFTLIVSLVLYVIFRYELIISSENLGLFWKIFWGVPLGYAVIWIGLLGPEFLKNVTKFGDLSYGVYIWHMIVVNSFLYFGLSDILKDQVGNTLTITIVVFVSLIIAFLSWWFIEKPSLKLKKFTSRDIKPHNNEKSHTV